MSERSSRRNTLFGLYQATPLRGRAWGFGNESPNQIVISQGHHKRAPTGEDELRVPMVEGPIHEVVAAMAAPKRNFGEDWSPAITVVSVIDDVRTGVLGDKRWA